MGRSGPRVERGIATSGMLGEVYKQDPDPQHSAECQRSWTHDPAIRAVKERLERDPTSLRFR